MKYNYSYRSPVHSIRFDITRYEWVVNGSIGQLRYPAEHMSRKQAKQAYIKQAEPYTSILDEALGFNW